MMEQWQDIGRALEEILRLQTYPLAVKLVKDAAEFPAGVHHPEQKLGICQALSISRRFGWTIAMTAEDSGCPAVNFTYGWPLIHDEPALVRFVLKAGYAIDEGVAQTIINNLDRFDPGRCSGVVFSPLTRTKIAPDVIIIYGTPAQIMRCIQGAMYYEGKKVRSEFAGMGASCTSGIIRTLNTGEFQVVVPGTVDRVCAGTHDSEMLFAVPADKAEDLISGMRGQRLARYPIPVVLPMPPPFPFFD